MNCKIIAFKHIYKVFYQHFRGEICISPLKKHCLNSNVNFIGKKP